MNCKHCEVKGNTTKYFWCRVKNKSISDLDCRDCMLKIESMPDMVNEIFGNLSKKK